MVDTLTRPREIAPNAQQRAVISQVAQWWKGHDLRPFYLSGYAGTGKTSLVPPILTALDLDVWGVAFMAPTGKASRVLSEKLSGLGNPLYCGTIHAALCVPVVTGDVARYEELQRALKNTTNLSEHDAIQRQLADMVRRGDVRIAFISDPSEPFNFPGGGGLIVVDEASMVDEKLGRDLMEKASRFGWRVLALGDPGQLPPVEGRAFFGPENCAMSEPLTTIERQKGDSAILKIATYARRGGRIDRNAIPYARQGEVALVSSSKITPERLARADIVICGKNETRHRINAEMRKHHGYAGTLPQPGEPVICTMNDPRTGVMNGEIGRVVESYGSGDNIQVKAQFDSQPLPVLLPLETRPDLARGKLYRKPTCEFAYAITAHKSQGSEFDWVILIDESYCFRNNSARWLYTGITRAKKRVTITPARAHTG